MSRAVLICKMNIQTMNMKTHVSERPLIKAIVFNDETISESYTTSDLSIEINNQQAEILPVEMGIGTEERLKQIAKQLKNLGEDEGVPKNPELLAEDEYDQYLSLKKKFSYLQELHNVYGRSNSPSHPPYELVPAILIQCDEELSEAVKDEERIPEIDFQFEGFRGQTYHNPLEPMVDGTEISLDKLIAELRRVLSKHQIEQVRVGEFWNIGGDAEYPRLHPERTVEIDSINGSELQSNLRVLNQ